MMKPFIAVALLLGTTTAFAQEKQYTPESGDWAIGIDANPFLSYAGNLIGGNDQNTPPAWNYLTTNQTITGKYFVSENMAYRGSIRLGFGSSKASAMIGQYGVAAPTFPTLPSMVEDSWKSGSVNVGLSGGVEWRKGKGRLQGFYGGELGVMISSSSNSYSYGNAVNISAQLANISTNFGNNITTDTYGNTARITETSSGTMLGLGLRGFIGAEYFIFQKISIGGEFGWGVAYTSTGAGSTSLESTNGVIAGTQKIEGTTSSSFGADTDNVNSVFGSVGTLRMTFHF